MRQVDPFASPERLIARVYAYAAYRIGSGPDADDVVQETFARALRYRDSFDPRKGDPAAWLVGIARRCLADRGVPAVATLTPEHDVGTAADEFETNTATRLDLQDALALLEPRERELLSLRYGADLTAKQIGELVGMKTNAVEVALHRALARLRAQLGEGGDAPAPSRSTVRPLAAPTD
ncbi:MAG TPA: RNA polymerase sigma factor [Gaiellaceae bacterium]